MNHFLLDTKYNLITGPLHKFWKFTQKIKESRISLFILIILLVSILAFTVAGYYSLYHKIPPYQYRQAFENTLGFRAWVILEKYPFSTVVLSFFIVWGIKYAWRRLTIGYRLLEEDEQKVHLTPETLDTFYPDLKDRFIKNIRGECLPAVIYCEMDEHTRYEIIDDASRFYALPDLVEKNFFSIMKAHHSSEKNALNNALLFRLDSWEKDELRNTISLSFSRVTFFDSLATNRALDFVWENAESGGVSLRKLFFGTGRYAAEEVPLANHLGVNGYIITADHKLIVSERDGGDTIGRFTMEPSIGAKLKGEYVFGKGKNGKLTQEGLELSMRKVLDKKYGKNFSVGKNLSMKDVKFLYASLLEGAKPQLFFLAKATESAEEIMRFAPSTRAWRTFSIKQVQHAYIGFDYCLIPLERNGILYKKQKKYFINSNTAVSLELFRQYVTNHSEQEI